MKAIETTAVVSDDRKMIVQLPPDVTPGPHHVVVVVDGPLSERRQTWAIKDWPVHDAALIDQNFTMTREELYGDGAR